MANIYIGTSGFYYPHWIGSFYPKGLSKDKMLPFYAKHFNTVEINSSFYRIPSKNAVNTWKKNTQSYFIFSFKASRIITHLKKLNLDKEIVNKFLLPFNIFASKPPRHLILFQTPHFLKADFKKLDKTLSFLPNTFLYAFELRHPSWFYSKTYQVLKKYNAALVLSDSPIEKNSARLWPYKNINTASFFYIRFHGSKSLYSSSYTDCELKNYAKLIKDKLKRGLSIYCYFNNDAQGWAVKNAKDLQSFFKY